VCVCVFESEWDLANLLIYAGDVDTLKALIRGGLAVDARHQGYPLVHVAIIRNSFEVAAELLSNGASVSPCVCVCVCVCLGLQGSLAPLLQTEQIDSDGFVALHTCFHQNVRANCLK
jgi:ankyrin repeat protein